MILNCVDASRLRGRVTNERTHPAGKSPSNVGLHNDVEGCASYLLKRRSGELVGEVEELSAAKDTVCDCVYQPSTEKGAVALCYV